MANVAFPTVSVNRVPSRPCQIMKKIFLFSLHKMLLQPLTHLIIVIRSPASPRTGPATWRTQRWRWDTSSTGSRSHWTGIYSKDFHPQFIYSKDFSSTTFRPPSLRWPSWRMPSFWSVSTGCTTHQVYHDFFFYNFHVKISTNHWSSHTTGLLWTNKGLHPNNAISIMRWYNNSIIANLAQ